MSGLTPIATVRLQRGETSKRARSCREQMQPQVCAKAQILLDHLVGAGEQQRWNHQANRLGSLEIDGQIERRRLRDR
jgi:hypothetical protein